MIPSAPRYGTLEVGAFRESRAFCEETRTSGVRLCFIAASSYYGAA